MKEVINIRVVLSVDTVLTYDEGDSKQDAIDNRLNAEVEKLSELREHIETISNSKFHIDVGDQEVY